MKTVSLGIKINKGNTISKMLRQIVNLYIHFFTNLSEVCFVYSRCIKRGLNKPNQCRAGTKPLTGVNAQSQGLRQKTRHNSS